MGTKTKKDDVIEAYFGDIVKTEKTDEGLLVYGKATGPDLDLDQQICDPAWLKKAMPDWMRWGNVREQHLSIAAGVGKELTEKGDDWMLKALVVDPVTIKKVETGVLKGYSIKIGRPRVVNDSVAKGGRIVDGFIPEVSLVDRPCNPDAWMTIAKAEGAALAPVDSAGVVLMKSDDPEPVEQPAETAPEAEPVDDADQMLADAAAVKGVTADVDTISGATPGPEVEPAAPAAAVLTPTAYRKAAATVAGILSGDIVKRAADETADIAGAQQVIAQLAALIASEAAELAAGRMEEVDDIACLMDAVAAVRRFLWNERDQDGQDVGGDTPGGISYVALAADGELEKRAFTQAQRDAAAKSGAAMPDGSYPIETKADLQNAIHAVGRGKGDHAAIRRHIIARAKAIGASSMIPEDWTSSAKAAEPDGVMPAAPKPGLDVTELVKAAVAEATRASEDRYKAIEAELAKVRAMPIPGGPMILPTAGTGTPAQPSPDQILAKRYRLMAEQAGNRDVANAYRALAEAHSTT